MGIIKPTFSLTANASSATTDAGPMSMSLSLSTTDSLDISEVQSKIVDMTSDTHQLLWDASDFTASGATGVDGGWLYMKNLLAENSPADLLHDIIISHTDADADDAGDAHRLYTLQPGEFCFFPWDATQDIYVDSHETNVQALECWLFVRTGTA